MNTRVVAAVLAAVLAIVGIAALWTYAASANRRAFDGAELATVYQVTEPIGANADASQVGSSVKQVKVPNSAVAKGAITDLATIEDLKTTVPLVTGEQLVAARFDKSGAKAVRSASIPDGLQEVSVELGPAAGLSDRLEEGARAGVIVTLERKDEQRARMVAQNLVVTGVTKLDNGNVVATLAVTTAQATQIAAGAQFGQIRLTVQNDETDRSGASSLDAGALVK